MKKVIGLAVFIFLILMNFKSVKAQLTVDERFGKEGDYILSCQFMDSGSSAYGAINNIVGYPTWVSPREVAMAILGLIIVSEKKVDEKYKERAQLAAEYLKSIQNKEDGSWSDQYSYTQIVDNAKSPTQTAEVMIAFYKLGYVPIRFNAMRQGAKYLMNCMKTENKGGIDDGLVCGGKNEYGNYYTDRWTHDNAYSYWALVGAGIWAKYSGDREFSLECENQAQRILNGIKTYLYDSEEGIWHIAISKNGIPLINPHLSCAGLKYSFPSWIQYSPVMLNLPLEKKYSENMGNWMRVNIQSSDGACYERYCEDGDIKIRKYPGLCFQAAIAYLNIGDYLSANLAISWAEQSGLWDSISGGWIDWIEVSHEKGRTAEYYLKFIDTSYYYIACLNGGLNIAIEQEKEEEEVKSTCFIVSLI